MTGSEETAAAPRPLGDGAIALIVFLSGFGAGLIGDACHVASGTTEYLWDLPSIWRSALWFPFLVGGSILAAAWIGRLIGLPTRRTRTREDAALGIAAVVALYALTAFLRGETETVSIALTAAIAAAIWLWWDPSPGAFAVGIGFAVLGPVAEIVVIELGGARYAADSDGLLGIAPWLPCLYFAAGSVASGLWNALRS